MRLIGERDEAFSEKNELSQWAFPFERNLTHDKAVNLKRILSNSLEVSELEWPVVYHYYEQIFDLEQNDWGREGDVLRNLTCMRTRAIFETSRNSDNVRNLSEVTTEKTLSVKRRFQCLPNSFLYLRHWIVTLYCKMNAYKWRFCWYDLQAEQASTKLMNNG